MGAPDEGAVQVSSVGEGVELLVGNVTTLYFLDTGLTNGETYHYRVSAVNSYGEGEAASVSATPKGVPDAPNVAATGGDGYINLTWNEPFDQGDLIAGYLVYRGLTPGALVFYAQTDGLYYNDTGLGHGKVYYYAVRAVNGIGLGELSLVVGSATFATPSVPTGVTATGGAGNVTLEWTAPIYDGGMPILGYNLYFGSDEEPFATVTGLTFTVTELLDGTTYVFRITAFSAVGEGSSVMVSAETVALPGAVSGLYVTPGNGQVPLSGWLRMVGPTATSCTAAPMLRVCTRPSRSAPCSSSMTGSPTVSHTTTPSSRSMRRGRERWRQSARPLARYRGLRKVSASRSTAAPSR
jgi:predicted RNA-binding protein with TRAM domain